MEAINAVDSPQTKAPPPFGDLHIEIETGTQNILAQKSGLSGLRDGNLCILTSKGVFMPDIDEPLAGSHGKGTDHHPFQDSSEDSPPEGFDPCRPRGLPRRNYRSRISFRRSIPTIFPLSARRKSRSSSSSQARGLDLVDNLIGLHFEQGLCQGLVPAYSDIVLDLRGFDLTIVSKDQPMLSFIERDLLLRS